MTRLVLLALVALAPTACGKKDQSFEAGMQELCGSTASLPSTMKPSEKATAIARAADEKVTNKEVRALAASLASLEGSAKLTRLREAATRAGIEHCGLAELWTESPMTVSLRVICESPNKVQLAPDSDPSSRAQAIADYIKANVTDRDALALMSELASDAPASKSAHLASVARAHGIDPCPLAELP